MTAPAIPEAHRLALLAIRDDLRSGALPHSKVSDPFSRDIGTPSQFCMLHFRGRGDCGTAACLGGHLSHRLGESGEGWYWRDRHMEKLFEPLFFPPRKMRYSAITPDQAADAIDNFLVDGDPRWEVVCADTIPPHHP